MESLALKGTLEVGGGACVSSCANGDRSVKSLALRCATGQQFQSAVETAEPIRIATPGAAGAAFVDLQLLGDLIAIEFLYVRVDNPIVLRVGANEAVLRGVAGVFPTLFAGGETLSISFAGAVVSVTFLAGDQTAAQCAARINAACALAGLATPRATVNAATGQIEIRGLLTGSTQTVTITAGTGATTLGLPVGASAAGAGADVPVWGTFLAEFGVAGSPPVPPARVQFSGNAGITAVAAGRTA